MKQGVKQEGSTREAQGNKSKGKPNIQTFPLIILRSLGDSLVVIFFGTPFKRAPHIVY